MKEDLVKIVGDYLQGRETDVAVDAELLKYAKLHQLEGIVYHQTKAPALKRAYLFAMATYHQRLHLKQTIQASLDAEHIPYFFVKGLEVAEHYPQPFLKTMGDLDLTVHLADKERAGAVLLACGMTEPPDDRREANYSEWHFTQGQLMVELHHALLYPEEVVNDPVLIDWVNGCWDNVANNELDRSYHLLYLLLHLRKHYINLGVGLRQFLDIACYSSVSKGTVPFDTQFMQQTSGGNGYHRDSRDQVDSDLNAGADNPPMGDFDSRGQVKDNGSPSAADCHRDSRGRMQGDNSSCAATCHRDSRGQVQGDSSSCAATCYRDSRGEIDWDWLRQECQRLGLLDFVGHVYGLIEAWWGLKYPLTQPVDPAWVQQTTESILQVGVFGFEQERRTHHSENQILFAQEGKWQHRRKLLFPTYKEMCQWEQYQGLIGRPYLYPYCWAKRILRHCLSYRDFIERVHCLLISDKNLKKRQQQLKDFGLK